MKMLVPYRKRHAAGFSLVEMAVVILIAGIMMGAGLSLLSVKQEAAKWDTSRKNQEAIKQALINYLGKNKRLPCPATAASGGAAAPPPPCPSYSGIVPYYELGLTRTAVLDGWENYITYFVSNNPITTPPPSGSTAWMYSYHATDNTSPNTTNASSAFWASNSTGGIKVTDGTATIADPSNATGAAVVLISHGKNGLGAVNVKGGTNDSTSAGTDEVINATPDSTNGAAITVVKRDTTDSTTGGGAFDDIVMILSANDLTWLLIANGTLQSNPQAALSQANNIVVGRIVASKNSGSYCDGSNYRYSIPSSVSFPDWGISYSRFVDRIYVCTSSGTAYTLTAVDGTQKTITIEELQGLIVQGAGGFY